MFRAGGNAGENFDEARKFIFRHGGLHASKPVHEVNRRAGSDSFWISRFQGENLVEKKPSPCKVPFLGGKGVTSKEHHSNIRQIEKVIEASIIQLRNAGMPVNGLSPSQKKAQSLKSGRPLLPNSKRGQQSPPPLRA
jgi:hypothetical protein